MGKKEQGGFKIPQGYFGRFPERLRERMRHMESTMPDTSFDAAQNPIEKATGTPQDRFPGGGFQTPKGYFETFSVRLEQRLGDAPGSEEIPVSLSEKSRVVPLRKRYLTWTAAAAAAVLLALVFWPASSGSTLDFGDIADAELESYLEIGYEGISAYELAENLPLEQLELGQVMDTGTQEQQLLEYLDSDPDVLEEVYWEEEEENE